MSSMYDLGKMASYQYFQMLFTCESWESSDFLNFRITIGEYCCCERIDLNFASLHVMVEYCCCKEISLNLLVGSFRTGSRMC